MPLEVLRSLSQLRQECSVKGINVEISSPREKKEDYVLALRDYYIQENYGGKLPRALELMLQIECPMLCKRYPEPKPEEQEAIWEGKEWYLERKIDGVRMVHFFVDGDFDFYSRNLSVTDYLPTSYRATIDTAHVDRSKIKDEFIIDAELECTSAQVSTLLEKRGVVTETQLAAVTAILAMEPARSIELQRAEGKLRSVAFDCIWWHVS